MDEYTLCTVDCLDRSLVGKVRPLACVEVGRQVAVEYGNTLAECSLAGKVWCKPASLFWVTEGGTSRGSLRRAMAFKASNSGGRAELTGNQVNLTIWQFKMQGWNVHEQSRVPWRMDAAYVRGILWPLSILSLLG